MVLLLNLNKPRRELLLQAASGLLRFDVDRAKQIEFLVAVDESGAGTVLRVNRLIPDDDADQVALGCNEYAEVDNVHSVGGGKEVLVESLGDVGIDVEGLRFQALRDRSRHLSWGLDDVVIIKGSRRS